MILALFFSRKSTRVTIRGCRASCFFGQLILFLFLACSKRIIVREFDRSNFVISSDRMKKAENDREFPDKRLKSHQDRFALLRKKL